MAVAPESHRLPFSPERLPPSGTLLVYFLLRYMVTRRARRVNEGRRRILHPLYPAYPKDEKIRNFQGEIHRFFGHNGG